MHLFEILEGFTVGAIAYAVINKIFIDRLANSAEKHIVKPALEFVKSTEFWDDLDRSVAEGMTKLNAIKCSLIDFGKADGNEEAIAYALKNYSDEVHQAKMSDGLENFMTLED